MDDFGISVSGVYVCVCARARVCIYACMCMYNGR